MTPTYDGDGEPILLVDGVAYRPDEFCRDGRGRHWQLRRLPIRRRFVTTKPTHHWIWEALDTDRRGDGITIPKRPLVKLELRPIPVPDPGPDPDKYPQHRKAWQLAQDGIDTQTVGLFLDTCGYVLCELADGHHFTPVGRSVEKILAEHYEIDYKAFMAEKDAMLAEIREANRG